MSFCFRYFFRIFQILYGHEAFGVAVLRSISALARQYVMRLLLCKDQRTSKITMDRWAKDVSIKEHNDALQRLFKIGVFERLDSSSSTVVQRAQTLLPQQQNEQTDTDNFDIVMSVQFANSIGSIVLGTRAASDQSTSTTNQPQKPEIEKAQQHAENCWKTLTSLLVNSGGRLPSRKVIDLLVDGGLVHYGARNSSLKITNAGFQFLLFVLLLFFVYLFVLFLLLFFFFCFLTITIYKCCPVFLFFVFF